MARPSKSTVEYFPHYCDHGKTLFILERKYGNDGYAFWFKLLEILGKTDGHYFRAENPADIAFLAAETRMDESLCTEILDLLAILEAIDAELWINDKVIWIQKFIDGLRPVYSKRATEIPSKPHSRAGNPPITKVYGEKTPQSKVKEVKEVKKESKAPPSNSKKDFSLKSLSYPDVLSAFKETFPDIDVVAELEKFFDDLKKKGKRWKDYHAAFRNWLRQPWVPKNGAVKKEKLSLRMCPGCGGTLIVPGGYVEFPFCPICPKADNWVLQSPLIAIETAMDCYSGQENLGVKSA